MASQSNTQDNGSFFTTDFWRDALIAIVSVVLGAILSFQLSRAATIDGIVKALSLHFEYIDETMSAEEAIEELEKKSNEQKRELDNKDSEIKKLQSDLANKNNALKNQQNEMDGMPIVTIESPALVVEGLRQDSPPGKSLAIIDGTSYYSESLIHRLHGGSISYSEDEKTVFYTTEESGKSTSKVELSDTTALHDGYQLKVYSGDSSEQLAIGSNTYSYGFTIDRHDDDYGFALFDLEGRYSILSFDVGRVNSTSVNDATLRIYLDGDKEPSQEYELSGDVGSQHINIPLDYAQSLKMELIVKYWTTYGFVNVVLSE